MDLSFPGCFGHISGCGMLQPAVCTCEDDFAAGVNYISIEETKVCSDKGLNISIGVRLNYQRSHKGRPGFTGSAFAEDCKKYFLVKATNLLPA